VAASKGVFHPNPPAAVSSAGPCPAQRVAKVIARRALNINDVLDRHVSREIDGVEWMLLNAYVPNLQVGGQVVTFLTEHPGCRIRRPRGSRRSETVSPRGEDLRRRAQGADPHLEKARPDAIGGPQTKKM
jgi:hypothetical protein